MNEDQLTMSVARLLREVYKLTFTHVANERKTETKLSKKGRRYSPEGNKLRQMGVRKGVSDMLIFKKSGCYGGLCIELKYQKITGIDKYGRPKYTRQNYPDKDQKEFLLDVWKEGYAVEVCWSIDEVIDTLDSYLEGTFRPSEYVTNNVLTKTEPQS